MADVNLKPLTDYESFVGRIRKFGDELKVDMAQMSAGQAIGIYNGKINKLRDEFVVVRIKDYSVIRKTQQLPQQQAERDHAGIGAPRRTTRSPAVYTPPEDMVYDSHDFNIQSSYGDCHAYIDVEENGKKVTFTLTARARSHGNGRSHIIATPIVIWKFDSNEAIDSAKVDFETLEKLSDDNYREMFKEALELKTV